ncbi:enoyl-CoA dehydratase [Actinomycetospora sp. NBRC 106375]|uniref:enoyl-CoA hydratase n=1 Tax=Actinomycetospora sp. NBRC 106375 TaxID=3032207 RepID=UPI00249FCABE|nr:enoyl-CoA hydratase [Actinomycetospora sp. NBRC 106375]GLZ47824.1 enoyl-CoA dehydratase [Actinomycetospora sp. NBRC 106375]
MSLARIDLPHAEAVVGDDGVGTLTVVNSRSANVLGTPAITDLRTALAELAQLDALRALVLRGTGDEAFVAGADIGEMAVLDQPSAEVFIEGLRLLCEAVRHLPVPVIARIPGWALGGGLELAMACDLRISSDAARFGMPEVAMGIPSVVHAALMPRLVGAAHASWMLLTGESVDAATALSWGLADEVVPLTGLDARVGEHAARFAGFGADVVRRQKRLLREWEEQTPSAAAVASVAEFGAAFATGEPQAFMRRFLERER